MQQKRDIDEYLDFQKRCDEENARWDEAVRRQLNWDAPARPPRLRLLKWAVILFVVGALLAFAISWGQDVAGWLENL
jgi:hypothetical protein